MTVYSDAFKALTTGRALRPDEAAQLLTDLRKETGTELADAVEQQLDGQFRRSPTDTDAEFRRKRRRYGGAMDAVNRLRRLATSPIPNVPHQRNRSTS